ncbi:hypothetical protein J4E85_009807 [Alternaria conjuncta]|uniref:uncharacterized protein n=1 Tax=Alternaria conjuncta TaxID=181017 RepID=UPI00221E4B9C|nr:uncharacterized protein J4E85_009807 [Alternaria conjuncta]KAI4917715.1 hypothetical protein J4E85_009807 [Alternaria conjuncta]
MSKAAEATGIDYTGWDEQKTLAAIAKAVAVWPRHDLSFVETDYEHAKRSWKNRTDKGIRQGERRGKVSTGGDHYEPGM